MTTSTDQLPKTALQTKRVRARAYIRVSHVGKARQTTLLSDAMQLDEARRYADYMDFALDEEASKQSADLDVSAFRKKWRDRPGLMRLYAAAQRGEFDVLIFYKISRLARSVREALDMIDAFEKLGVSFHFVAEKIDSTSAQGRFLRNVLLSAAEMQSEDASAFLKSTCERRAREGKLQGGQTPSWIRRVEDGTLELIPEQVAAMQRMVELRLQGLGYVRLTAKLNEEGFRTVNGKYWIDGTVYRYLQPTWIRTMLGHGAYNRDKPEEIEIPNAYPPILTQDEADTLLAVQKLYSEDYGRKPHGYDWMVAKRQKRGRYSASSIHLLSSICFCPYCGARMVATMKDKGNRSTPFTYTCPRYKTRRDVHPKGLGSVNALSLEDAVLRVLREVLAMPPSGGPPQKPKVNEGGLEQAQAKIDRLITMHLDGKIKDEDFERAYADLVVQKEHIQAQVAENLLPIQHQQALALAAKDELTREELRQLVLLMVERVEAPITIEGVTIRSDVSNLRRLARVILRFPTAGGTKNFIAGIYMPAFSGQRCLVLYNPDAPEGLRALVPDATAERERHRSTSPLQ